MQTGAVMSPDLKRLCEAAIAGDDVAHPSLKIGMGSAESIVRAVLLELRDPSGAMIRSMCRAMSPGRRPTPKRVSVSEKHTIRWQAAIDRILERPSSAVTEATAAGVPVREGEG